MSHASLKEQLEAVASQLSDKLGKQQQPTSKAPRKVERPQQRTRTEKPVKPKPKWLEHAQYGVELLRTYFPDCFKMGNEAKPLKIGIKQDLLKRLSTIETIVTEDKACMTKSLSYYVNMASYHKSVVAGAERIDLDGQPAGVVTAEEAKYSSDRQQAKLQAKLSAKAAQQIPPKVEMA